VIDEPAGIAGLTVRRVESLPERLDGAVCVGPFSSARPGLLLRVVPGTGRFLARDGRSLEYWIEPGADPVAVEALLHGGVLGALIHQRGDLPLHATTLVCPSGRFAVALGGHSGAGKSTTAYELVRRGWTILSDDLTRVSLETGVPVAWPGRSRLRLLPDACRAFGLDPAALASAPKRLGKYIVDLPRWQEPIALSTLVALERTDGPLEVATVFGASRSAIIAEHTYRPHYLAALGRTAHHFRLVAATAAFATVLRLRGSASVQEVADVAAAAAPSIDAQASKRS
jgi:hypothetical protein